jgi:hypothetical protein
LPREKLIFYALTQVLNSSGNAALCAALPEETQSWRAERATTGFKEFCQSTR